MRLAIAAVIVLTFGATLQAGQTRRYNTPPIRGPIHTHLRPNRYCAPHLWNQPIITRSISPALPPFRSMFPYQPYQVGPTSTTSRTYVGGTTSTPIGKPQLIINPYVDQTGFEELGVR